MTDKNHDEKTKEKEPLKLTKKMVWGGVAFQLIACYAIGFAILKFNGVF